MTHDLRSSVFLLWHVQEADEYKDKALLVGVYGTRQACHSAVERLKDKPGFRDHVPGFEIAEYVIDQDHWEEGFISSEEALDALRDPGGGG